MQLEETSLQSLLDQLEPVMESMGFELVELVLVQVEGKRTLRAIIDRQEGITIEDCVAASRQISMMLDVSDPLDFAYHLEVSSPGIFRELKKDKDFARFKGARIKVKLVEGMDLKKKLVGLLGDCDEAYLELETDKGLLKIERSTIKKVECFPKI